MGQQHITIHDIARELNVSASTVSRALQDHPRISTATRESVKKLATKYNYQPSVMASSLRKGKSKTAGVIVPRINRNFFSNVIGALEETLTSSGYRLMICQTYEKIENEVAAVQTLINARVDAILLSISMETTNGDHLDILKKRGIQLFFFDRILENSRAGSVVIDNRMGAYMSVSHLLDQGYRRIMHVAGADHIKIYRDRKEGYLQAMGDAGIEVPPTWIIEKPLVLAGGMAAFSSALALPTPPDALFCAGDYAALGVMQAALKKGLRIPTDLGVTGFANEPFTEFLEPSLTTVDQKSEEMGTKVAEMLLECVEGEMESTDCRLVEMQPELIVRNSSLLNRKT